MGSVDLHIHSTASDGKSTPREIVQKASDLGLDTIAITDHDTYNGFFEARKAGDELDVRVLPGIEVTGLYEQREVHILAYCFDVASAELQQLLQAQKIARINRARWIIGELRKQGLNIEIREVMAQALGGLLARPHIAEVLINKGYVGSLREAFIRYLSDQALGNIKSNYVSYREVIDEIHNAGGAAVLAHPGLSYTDDDLETFVKAGIDGIEYLHPSHNYNLQQKYNEFAGKHQLLKTGGSDYHGGPDEYSQYFGILTLGKSELDRLIQMTDYRKSFSTTPK